MKKGEQIVIKKEIPAVTVCPKCHGNIFGGAYKDHDCAKSLLERNMKLDPISKKPMKMTEKEIKEKKNIPEPQKIAPADPDKDNKIKSFVNVCEQVSKQLEKVKTEKEIEAVEERFNKAYEKFQELKLDKTPEIVNLILGKFEALKK